MRLTLLLCVLAANQAAAQTQYDILIRGGTVVSGTAAPRQTDIGIRGDRIVLVGPAGNATAKRTIDAKGLVVAPGFIDPHTHTGGDLSSAQSTAGVPNRANLPYLLQGVTTVITNNDGGGPVDMPIAPASIACATSFFIESFCAGVGCADVEPTTAPRTDPCPM